MNKDAHKIVAFLYKLAREVSYAWNPPDIVFECIATEEENLRLKANITCRNIQWNAGWPACAAARVCDLATREYTSVTLPELEDVAIEAALLARAIRATKKYQSELKELIKEINSDVA